PLLRVTPFIGRNFQAEEDKRDSQNVPLLSYGYWPGRFAGSPNTVNRQQLLNGENYTIIGVLPRHFEFPLSAKDVAVWVTVAGGGGNLKEGGAHVLLALGRLKPNVSLEGAQNDLERITANLAREYPRSNSNTTAYVVSAHEQLVGRDLRQALWILLGAVGFILLIACTNTAN